jgi:transcriptional regulator GlxA family with amidase domain
MRITVLALDQVFDTGFTVLIDALPIANNLSVRAMGRESPFDLSVAGVQKKVRTGRGLAIPVQAVAQMVRWRAEGALIAASCVGTFLVAETGLLDHREATTTWWLSPLFRQRYPTVKLDESRMLVPTDTGVTASAAMRHLDLAL